MDNKMNLTLLADFYEITMANGYLEHGVADQIAYYDVFFQKKFLMKAALPLWPGWNRLLNI